MTEDQFWTLVQAPNFHESSDEISEHLKLKLNDLNDDELACFDKYFNLKMRETYTWDLWAAAFIISGCNSEYAFSEFRSWLISRGKAIFNKTIENPDNLAGYDVIPFKDEQPYPFLDEYDLLAGQIYEDRTEEELPFIPSGIDEPSGKRFKNKAKMLKEKYPALFELFWKK
ncbi:DUF4240 domain-containing protein [Pseudoalteromonas denitrificans]|jgi:hypothetical protein|uniref:DUF4240 domain-containing protein n=1 Tax=Pseudoalteromonas denitrificans DSM 6059 TaxID=1123010 RepID=A0A1I1FGI3_9GAMM|nr:DUF4240 domain-containing protein [Pseudoalteromonas denitrificans]SFB96233.1 Protein of unknown function [Pseudoalteromonas denitrificans DSM 6059]